MRCAIINHKVTCRCRCRWRCIRFFCGSGNRCRRPNQIRRYLNEFRHRRCRVQLIHRSIRRDGRFGAVRRRQFRLQNAGFLVEIWLVMVLVMMMMVHQIGTFHRCSKHIRGGHGRFRCIDHITCPRRNIYVFLWQYGWICFLCRGDIRFSGDRCERSHLGCLAFELLQCSRVG